MNAGEVENPGAFDSDEKTAKTTPVGGGKNPPESSQLIDPDEPIGDDGVNYDVYADSEKEAEDERIKYLSKCYEDMYLIIKVQNSNPVYGKYYKKRKKIKKPH